MTELSIHNIDDTLKSLRSQRADIERKSKARDEEYKRATKLYIKSLQKETEAFERNRANYDQRNDSFLTEVHGVMDRFRVGAFGLLKSRDRLHKEIDRLNGYLLDHYPKLATQVKISLQKEKEDLEERLKKIKEENEQNRAQEYNLRLPSANLIEIKEKRLELDRELRSSAPDYAYLKDFQNNPGYLDRFLNIPVRQPSPYREISPHIQSSPIRQKSPYRQPSPIRQKSPFRNPSYLDEFLVKSNPEELIHSKPPTTRLEPRSATPSYMIEREREIAPRIISGQPKTDMLSEFMYRVPNVVFSPSKNLRGVSPAKSESLLYSPFSGGGVDTESRFSRPSSMKKGQQLY